MGECVFPGTCDNFEFFFVMDAGRQTAETGWTPRHACTNSDVDFVTSEFYPLLAFFHLRPVLE